jgi:hypothetical protein
MITAMKRSLTPFRRAGLALILTVGGIALSVHAPSITHAASAPYVSAQALNCTTNVAVNGVQFTPYGTVQVFAFYPDATSGQFTYAQLGTATAYPATAWGGPGMWGRTYQIHAEKGHVGYVWALDQATQTYSNIATFLPECIT